MPRATEISVHAWPLSDRAVETGSGIPRISENPVLIQLIGSASSDYSFMPGMDLSVGNRCIGQ